MALLRILHVFDTSYPLTIMAVMHTKRPSISSPMVSRANLPASFHQDRPRARWEFQLQGQ
jgi:hypothetical protein